jgi:predicted metal-binding protein
MIATGRLEHRSAGIPGCLDAVNGLLHHPGRGIYDRRPPTIRKRVMSGLESPDVPSAGSSEPAPAPGHKPGPVLLTVCASCAGKSAAAAALVETLRAKLDPGTCTVRAVQCLGACNRRVRGVTVALSAPDAFTFFFGDLTPGDSASLSSFIQSYREADYGLVPWEQQPHVLRTGLVARLPPPTWPDEEVPAPAPG